VLNLADWAELVGLNRHTAYRWFRKGGLPVPAERVGWLILVKITAASASVSVLVVYERVSSRDQRSDLDRQVGLLTIWAGTRDLPVGLGASPSCRGVVCESDSGLNDKRPRLDRILSDPDAKVVFVENRDRLARLGIEHLRAALVRSHFGARRFAFNWSLAQVKADLDAHRADPTHDSLDRDLKSLRWAWNRAKQDIAPWWATDSKGCYSSGLTDLAQGLANWKNSKNGTRQGRRAGFPRFKSTRRDHSRVRFTTGTKRVEGDRRAITVPVIGGLRSKENTRRVQRQLATGRAQILNMTLSQRWNRLFVSVCYALRTPTTARSVTSSIVRAGVDLGIRTLATVAILDTITGEQTIIEYPNPAPLKATLAARRRAGRQLCRRIPGSRGHRAAKAKLSRLDRRCVHLRREATDRLTTELAGSYGQLVIETLDLEAMKRSMGRRAFRRSVFDAAMGLVKPQLAYKAGGYAGAPTVSDRWFASSQIHHGHTTSDGASCLLIDKGHIGKKLVCLQTGQVIDRGRNAGLNLRDWPDYVSCGPVGTTAPSVPGPTGPSVGKDHGADAGSSAVAGASRRPHSGEAGSGEARTQTPQGDAA
jgi:putative transposase